MTRRAAFAQSWMFEYVWFCLFAVAIGTRFVHACHGKAAVRFHDVHTVRIVALDAVHFAFEDGVVLRQVEFNIGGNVALETGFGLFAGIDDKSASAGSHVFASRAVARFAALLARHFRVGYADARVRTRWKDASDLVMAISTSFVADVSRAFDLRRGDDGAPFETCAGIENHNRSRCKNQQEQGNDDAFHRDWAYRFG